MTDFSYEYLNVSSLNIASDISRRGVARLAGVEAPEMEDNETNFTELIERTKKSIDYLKTFNSEQKKNGIRISVYPKSGG